MTLPIGEVVCGDALELVRRLVTMLTDDGGTVLDCYVGGGTTAEACVLEGRDFLACDRDPDFCEVTRRRVAHWRVVSADEARAHQPALALEETL